MAYVPYNPAVPVPSGVTAQTVIDARNNMQAIMDGLVFSGISTWKVNWEKQNSDGTPATDPLIPDQYVGTSTLSANDMWKAANTYDSSNGNRPTITVYYRSYDAGVTWNLIKTTTLTYDGSGSIIDTVDS
jgi:hypothetical protein